MKTCKSCGLVHGRIGSCPKCGALTSSGLLACVVTTVVCVGLVGWLILHPRTVSQTTTAQPAPLVSFIDYVRYGWDALSQWAHREGFRLLGLALALSLLRVSGPVARALADFFWTRIWTTIHFRKLKKLVPSPKVFEFMLKCVLAYVVYLSLLLPFVRPSKESEVWSLGILFALVVGYAWTRLRSGREV